MKAFAFAAACWCALVGSPLFGAAIIILIMCGVFDDK